MILTKRWSTRRWRRTCWWEASKEASSKVLEDSQAALKGEIWLWTTFIFLRDMAENYFYFHGAIIILTSVQGSAHEGFPDVRDIWVSSQRRTPGDQDWWLKWKSQHFQTPAHSFPDFTFRTYAPVAFRWSSLLPFIYKTDKKQIFSWAVWDSFSEIHG